ncbi:hypothetical protein ACVYZQ_004165 [Raoultella ornithinolytica]
MTSKLTREKAQWLHDACEEAAAAGIKLTMNPNELLMFTSYVLAAMDSEPVAEVLSRRPGNDTSTIDRALPVGTTLYRHAQQPVVQPMMFIDGDISSEDADKLAKVIREFNEEDERPLAKMARIIRENPHPTNECDMPKSQPQPQPAPVVQMVPEEPPEHLMPKGNTVDATYRRGAAIQAWKQCRAAMLQSGNSPVIPDGYVMVPLRLTAENGAKGALAGEFSETKFVNCPECFGDDECETCDGSGRIEIKVPVSWTTIKEIWIKGVEHFAAAPQENN